MRRARRAILLAAALLALAAATAAALAQAPMAGGPRAGPAGGYGEMMPGYGYGMMGGPSMMPGYGRGMMGGYGMMQVLPSNATPLSDDAVRARLLRAADGIVRGATLHDIMVFTNNVYAQVLDPDGNAVAEILLDRYGGAVGPEPGPNMMWNARVGMAGGYGMMPGQMMPGTMMPGYGRGYGPAGPAAQAPGRASRPQPRYDEGAATDLANAFLAGYLPGATVLGSQSFPGYYTFDYGEGGRPAGMLSVNADTGRVWPHTWHGSFIREME